MKRTPVFFFTLVIFFLTLTSVGALEVRIAGDKLTLEADRIPLQDILRRFAHLGIKIRTDPGLNPEVSASFEEKEIQKGLDSILKSFDYVLIWETIQGPPGPMLRLAEIHVFKPGEKELLRELGSGSALNIGKNPVDGSLFVRDEILLRLKPGMNLQEFNRLLRQIGGTVLDSYPTLGIYRVLFPENSDVPSLLEHLKTYPGVAETEPNYAYPMPAPEKHPATALSAGDIAEISLSGSDAPIAILDSGLTADSGLHDLVLASLDVFNPDSPISDSLGHGTQMALIAAGAVKPHGAGTGAGTSRRIIPIKAFDENGFTSNFDIMKSIDFAIDYGARVMSLSWGSEHKSDFLERSLHHANLKGLIIVGSAGNEPTGKPFYPAAYPSVIGVGALGPDGRSWKESNYGNFVTLYAPGFASLPVGHGGDPGTYAGTSISTAFMANIIASYLSENPKASILEVFQAVSKYF